MMWGQGNWSIVTDIVGRRLLRQAQVEKMLENPVLLELVFQLLPVAFLALPYTVKVVRQIPVVLGAFLLGLSPMDMHEILGDNHEPAVEM